MRSILPRHAARLAVGLLALAVVAPLTNAQEPSPGIGWQAELNGLHHGVGGTVTPIDEDTIQVDNFTYDGQGLDVFFYLGAEDSFDAFSGGLAIGPQLLGTVFDGTQAPLVIDLPAGQTLDGWNAIAVWCVDVPVSFGSAAFAPIDDNAPGDFNGDEQVDAADYTVWRDNADGLYAPAQYAVWRSRYAAQHSGVSNSGAAPEPAGGALLAGLVCAGGLRSARFRFQ